MNAGTDSSTIITRFRVPKQHHRRHAHGNLEQGEAQQLPENGRPIAGRIRERAASLSVMPLTAAL